MPEIKRILLVDDDANDIELALTALAKYNLANEPPPGSLSRLDLENLTGGR